ncbi:aminotransferase-like domain-containing protein [Cochlodiniinecator piscidefendens]|uniref:aminotransferase-like domain-containing protein n=1 Tax=Cochlodiniinecator piscidefendens TaxID=2715756 RepID=UPI0014094B35|nr:PLP-dependent aminotransferase family protein [Cochlodiniinecator piscidefendens]
MGTIWTPDITAGTGSKYQTLADFIRNSIEKAHLSVGEKVPTVRDLAWEIKVTPGTVARAYSLLVSEGVLEAVVGRGTFVASPKSSEIVSIHSPVLVNDWPETVSLKSPRLPDVGQTDAIRHTYQKMSESEDSWTMRYPSGHNDRKAREVLCSWISDWLLDPVLGNFSADDMTLTYGSQNGLILCLQSILRGARPVIFVEELSYPGFRHAAQLLRADVVGIKCDENGILPEALEEAIKTYRGQVLCTSPDVHNPTATHTPLWRRQQIADVARRGNLQVIEDDCYGTKRSSVATYRALLPETGWYLSSMSKSFTPSLRIGYVISPKARASELRRVSHYSHFGLAKPLCDVIETLYSNPKTRDLLHEINRVMSEYVRSAVNILGGFDLSWRENAAFFWVQLPRGWRGGNFCRAAEAEGVLLRSADDFALLDGRAPNAVRISVNAQVSLACFEDALSKLRRLLSNPPDEIEV